MYNDTQTLSGIQFRADHADTRADFAFSDRKALLVELQSAVIDHTQALAEIEHMRFLLGALYSSAPATTPKLEELRKRYAREFDDYQRFRRAKTPQRLLAWMACHVFCYLGHIVWLFLARVPPEWERAEDWLVTRYNCCMVRSDHLNERFAFSVWKPPRSELLPITARKL